MITRVSIVEDNRIDRQFYADLINHTMGFECSSQHATPSHALDYIAADNTDLVLMDILFAEQPTGIECVRELRSRAAAMSVLMLTGYSDDELLFECFRAGADGYILKSDPPDKLVDAMREVCAGGSPMSAPIARRVLKFFRGDAPEPNPLATLSPRELQIVDQMARGDTYAEIGGHLGLSEGTVRTHVRHIYRKLQVHSRTESVALYARHQPG